MAWLWLVRRLNAFLRKGARGTVHPTGIDIDKVRVKRRERGLWYHSRLSHGWHKMDPHEEIEIVAAHYTGRYPGSWFV